MLDKLGLVSSSAITPLCVAFNRTFHEARISLT